MPAPYELDPEIAPLVAAMPQFEATDVAEARRLFAAFIAAQPPYEPPIPLTIVDDVASGPDGTGSVPVRVYAPAGADRDPLPGVLYLHGGGFSVGDLDSEHNGAARIAAEVQTVVVSVDYRLAPEHPFPAGLDDCYAALVWMAAHVDELGVDPDRLAVRGASAGVVWPQRSRCSPATGAARRCASRRWRSPSSTTDSRRRR